MKKVVVLLLFGFLCFTVPSGAVAKDVMDVSHLEFMMSIEVPASAWVPDPVLVNEQAELEVGQEYLLAIIDGDGISIWNTGPLNLTCSGRHKTYLGTPDNEVVLFSLNGLGDSKDSQSFFRFTPSAENDRVELYISDEARGDNRGYVTVGLFKVLKQLKNLDRGVK